VNAAAILCRRTPALRTHSLVLNNHRCFSTQSNSTSAPRQPAPVKTTAAEDLREYISDELDALSKKDKDQEFLEEFMDIGGWKVDGNDPTILRKRTNEEEVTLDADPQKLGHECLVAVPPELGSFNLLIKKQSGSIEFKCTFNKSQQITIEKLSTFSKDGSCSSINPTNMDEKGQDILYNLLYEKGITDETCQVVDVLLNIRDDKAYLRFLKILQQNC